MPTDREKAIEKAMTKLRRAARAHREAVEELKQLGLVSSHGLVGALGERIAADYYRVKLDPASTRGKGYDLITRDGKRIEVKTLRTAGFRRSSRQRIGLLEGNYDRLLAIRLDAEYRPTEAIEVPRRIVEKHYPRGTVVTWSWKLEGDPTTRRITGEQLLARGDAKGAEHGSG
jgi:hypothetical protein